MDGEDNIEEVVSDSPTSEDERELLGPDGQWDSEEGDGAQTAETTETEMEVDSKRKADDNGTDSDQAGSKKQKLEESAPDGTIPLRGYQKEISERILKGENDIIILPTGTGKTAVAANLILQHLYSYKMQGKLDKAKVLFLVPKVVLVDQQLEFIRKFMGPSWSHYCRRLSGGDLDSMERLRDMFKEDVEFPVIVATPGSVFNYFKAYKCSTMRDFSLIIFDECHNAKGNDPYNRLLQRHLLESHEAAISEDKLPQLVGLTATIGIGDSKKTPAAVSFIYDACAKLGLDSAPTKVEQCKEELEGLIDPPYKDTHEVTSVRDDKFSRRVQEIMKGMIKDLSAKLKENPITKGLSIKFKVKSNDMMDPSFLQTVRTVQSELDYLKCDGDVSVDLNTRFEHLKIYHHALVWANLATCKYAMDYIKESMSSSDIQTPHPLQTRYQDEWLTELETLSSNEPLNEKLEKLKTELDTVLKADRMEDEESSPRVMVFVQHRRLAAIISDWLETQGYKSHKFVSSQASVEKDGMSKADAEFVMNQFREGELNILVATSVLSEGVDVPECNAVIRYMYIKDVIAEVQVPGRVRSKNGRVVAIFDKKLKTQYVDNRFREKIMNQALEQIRNNSNSFKEEMKSRRARLNRECALASKCQKTPKSNKLSTEEVKILCRKCRRKVGSLSEVYQYMETHFIVLSSTLDENFIQTSPECCETIDAMTEDKDLFCSDNCSLKIGEICQIKLTKLLKKRVLKWKIDNILFSSESPVKMKSWVQVAKKYTIPVIMQEELIEKENELMDCD